MTALAALPPLPRGTSAVRVARERLMLGLASASAAAAIAVLACILGYVVWQGASHVHWSFFTNLPAPVGEEGGGFANALAGTGLMVGLASAMSIPVGVLGGIYLAEFGQGALARAVRFVNDAVNATPSIVAGLFAYTLIVLETRHFSAFAGSVALAVLMVPTITRTTEEMVRLVPRRLRDAALALGVPEWRMTLDIVVRSALPGIVTGICLAVARVGGETAALLFTAFNNRFLSTDLDGPMASVPVQVYTCSISPYEDWHHQAWAGALMLVVLIATLSAAVKLAARARHA